MAACALGVQGEGKAEVEDTQSSDIITKWIFIHVAVRIS